MVTKRETAKRHWQKEKCLWWFFLRHKRSFAPRRPGYWPCRPLSGWSHRPICLCRRAPPGAIHTARLLMLCWKAQRIYDRINQLPSGLLFSEKDTTCWRYQPAKIMKYPNEGKVSMFLPHTSWCRTCFLRPPRVQRLSSQFLHQFHNRGVGLLQTTYDMIWLWRPCETWQRGSDALSTYQGQRIHPVMTDQRVASVSIVTFPNKNGCGFSGLSPSQNWWDRMRAEITQDSRNYWNCAWASHFAEQQS